MKVTTAPGIDRNTLEKVTRRSLLALELWNCSSFTLKVNNVLQNDILDLSLSFNNPLDQQPDFYIKSFKIDPGNDTRILLTFVEKKIIEFFKHYDEGESPIELYWVTTLLEQFKMTIKNWSTNYREAVAIAKKDFLTTPPLFDPEAC
jgi:hypothetical protein